MSGEYKETEIGVLPEEWQVKKLSDVIRTQSGGTPSRDEPSYFGGSIPWVKSGELRDTIIQRSEESISDLGMRNSSCKLIPPNTVLVALYGATVGRVGFLTYAATTNQAVCALLTSSAISEWFLFYSIMHHRPFLLSERYGGAQPNISQTIIRNLKIAIPSLPEQKTIAHVLRSVQTAREATTSIIEAARELKRSLMAHLFTYGVVSPEGAGNVALKDTEIGLAPDEWSIEVLGDLCDCLDNKRRPVRANERKPGPVPYYGASGQTGWIDRYIFDEPLLLLAEDGENLETRKLPIAYPIDGKSWVNNHAHVLRAHRANREYLEGFINQMDISSYLTGTTRPKLNKALMLGIKIKTPPIETQETIATILQSVDAKLQAEQAREAALGELFRTLLHDLMTGRVRVQDFGGITSKDE